MTAGFPLALAAVNRTLDDRTCERHIGVYVAGRRPAAVMPSTPAPRVDVTLAAVHGAFPSPGRFGRLGEGRLIYVAGQVALAPQPDGDALERVTVPTPAVIVRRAKPFGLADVPRSLASHHRQIRL